MASFHQTQNIWYPHLTNFLLEMFNLESMDRNQEVHELGWQNSSYIYISPNI